MPKPTVKSLEEQIVTLREFRTGDANTNIRLREQLETAKYENERVKVRLADLERDKAWLKQVIQQLLLEPKERSSRS